MLVLATGALSATEVEVASLEEQIRDAEVIVVGTVREVKMKGRFGLPARDPAAQTGPGSSYSLWLLVEFDRSWVLKGDPQRLPKKKLLPVWQGWIKDLRSEREVSLGRAFVFFLTAQAEPASVQFKHFDSERAEIEAIVFGQNKKVQPDGQHNAGGRPSSGDSQVSQTPSSLAPRG